eukprot:5021750-Prymnesium_polylepis.1
MSTRDQAKASSRTVELIDERKMSEASARRRRAAIQWICFAGIRRATEAHDSPAEPSTGLRAYS